MRHATKTCCSFAILTAATALSASGCTPVGTAVGAGATAGVMVAQERSVGDAVEDTLIEVEVNRRLATTDFGDLFQAVGVESVEGRVLLIGRVKTVELRDQAGIIAWQVDNVRAVLNEIEVNTEGGGAVNYLRDRKITNELRARLLGDGGIRHINYVITTRDAAVYLLGIGRDRDEVSRVIAHAREIPNVRKVVDHVVLRDDPRRAEQAE